MALKDRLMQDLKDSMKSKNIITKNTVQMIRSQILQVEKDNKVVLDDEGIIDVISKMLKQRRNALPEYEKSNRQDLIDDLNEEINILLDYLPKQLSQQELEVIVKSVIEEIGATGMKDLGSTMKEVMIRVKGKADGKTVNETIRKLL